MLLIMMVLLPVALAAYPYVQPTVGEPWPRPQSQMSSSTFFDINPQTFSFDVINFSCEILTTAIARYADIISTKSNGVQSVRAGKASLESVQVQLLAECEDLPYLNMDEQYEIKVDSPDRPNEASIKANSIWGMLRGLETFAQLVVADGDTLRINSTQIMDFPRFTHRGFMIDTSRHFLPLSTIEEMLDLMSMNKLNVLHWHIVDSQSFPYESSVYPDLSLKGAWTPRHVYSLDNVTHVVNYARERGIRVMAEFDTPGHTLSWGLGQPDLLTQCYDKETNMPDGTLGPIDPTKETSYDFLTSLFTEVTTRFPDHYIHLGGDEVPFACWDSNPDVRNFMVVQNISTYSELEEYYITRLLNVVSALPTKNGYMVWQEVFDNGVQLADDTVVHVWKYRGNITLIMEEMSQVTQAGFQTLLSSCWYLNDISYGIDWKPYYECDPQQFQGTAEQKSLVMGGEACMWGEYVDRTNIIARSWPRGSVVAEKLWSSAEQTADADAASPRLEEHRCRLLGRGYSVQPLWPSYCEADLV